MTTSWLRMQLIDGGFPAGGFAHSQGLEAAMHFRGVARLESYLDEALWQAGRTSLPFVRRACEDASVVDASERLAELDALFEATCTSHIANRASRAQGRALASTCSQVWDAPAIQRIGAYVKAGGCAHHAVVFGAVFGALGLGAEDAQMAFLHGVARGVVSAGVRLGLLGPIEGQRVIAEAGSLLAAILAKCMELEPVDAAQAAPLAELFGALHDRLDGRLFQS